MFPVNTAAQESSQFFKRFADVRIYSTDQYDKTSTSSKIHAGTSTKRSSALGLPGDTVPLTANGSGVNTPPALEQIMFDVKHLQITASSVDEKQRCNVTQFGGGAWLIPPENLVDSLKAYAQSVVYDILDNYKTTPIAGDVETRFKQKALSEIPTLVQISSPGNSAPPRSTTPILPETDSQDALHPSLSWRSSSVVSSQPYLIPPDEFGDGTRSNPAPDQTGSIYLHSSADGPIPIYDNRRPRLQHQDNNRFQNLPGDFVECMQRLKEQQETGTVRANAFPSHLALNEIADPSMFPFFLDIDCKWMTHVFNNADLATIAYMLRVVQEAVRLFYYPEVTPRVWNEIGHVTCSATRPRPIVHSTAQCEFAFSMAILKKSGFDIPDNAPDPIVLPPSPTRRSLSPKATSGGGGDLFATLLSEPDPTPSPPPLQTTTPTHHTVDNKAYRQAQEMIKKAKRVRGSGSLDKNILDKPEEIIAESPAVIAAYKYQKEILPKDVNPIIYKGGLHFYFSNLFVTVGRAVALREFILCQLMLHVAGRPDLMRDSRMLVYGSGNKLGLPTLMSEKSTLHTMAFWSSVVDCKVLKLSGPNARLVFSGKTSECMHCYYGTELSPHNHSQSSSYSYIHVSGRGKKTNSFDPFVARSAPRTTSALSGQPWVTKNKGNPNCLVCKGTNVADEGPDAVARVLFVVQGDGTTSDIVSGVIDKERNLNATSLAFLIAQKPVSVELVSDCELSRDRYIGIINSLPKPVAQNPRLKRKALEEFVFTMVRLCSIRTTHVSDMVSPTQAHQRLTPGYRLPTTCWHHIFGEDLIVPSPAYVGHGSTLKNVEAVLVPGTTTLFYREKQTLASSGETTNDKHTAWRPQKHNDNDVKIGDKSKLTYRECRKKHKKITAMLASLLVEELDGKTALKKPKLCINDPSALEVVHQFLRSLHPQWRHLQFEDLEILPTTIPLPSGYKRIHHGTPIEFNASEKAAIEWRGSSYRIYATGPGAHACTIVNRCHHTSTIGFKIYPTWTIQICSSQKMEDADGKVRTPCRSIFGRMWRTPESVVKKLFSNAEKDVAKMIANAKQYDSELPAIF